jgi:hypothetical protein
MPATERPKIEASKENAAPAILSEDFLPNSGAFGTLNSVASRENFVRNVAKKWFGKGDAYDASGRGILSSRHEEVVQALCRLHRLSCNLVTESKRIPIQEYDVFAAIVVLNRISVTLRSPLSAVIAYCEARSIREQGMIENQLDPLQLRHLLTFHEDIPHEEMNALEIHMLKAACETADKIGIQRWFENIARRKATLPKDAPQFLRQMAADLWSEGKKAFLDVYATELAILDATLLEEMGWENTRLFSALFKRLQGSGCKVMGDFMNAAEITIAMEQYRQLDDAETVVHFRALSTTFEATRLRRLESTILSAPREGGSRIKTEVEISPVAKKKMVTMPPAFSSPEYYSQKNLRPVS